MSAVPVKSLFLLLPVLAVLLAVPVLVGVYVYRDARRRGMNAVLWTLIAIISPALIGFIIYLLVRGSYPDLECPQCGASVTEQFVVCPQCGTQLRPACPSCAGPVEPDWKVCPRCAAPLDEARSHVAPPLRRQDKSLNKILIAVIVVPVALILLIVFGLAAHHRTYTGICTLQEITFEEYDQLQPSETVRIAVSRWLDSIHIQEDRAYALRYDLPGEYDYENEYYFLIYVPAGGQQTDLSFGASGGLFGATLTLDLARTGYSGSLFCMKVTAEKPPKPDITLDGKHIRCDVRIVNYNPTIFPIYPDYSQVEPDEVLYFPERLTIYKMVSTGRGASSVVDMVQVTDEDTMFKILAVIDGGERLDWGDPIYEGSDISGGFDITIEYQVHEGYIFHDDMARLRMFQQDGACYVWDTRIRHSGNFRLVNQGFYDLLEGLFTEN